MVQETNDLRHDHGHYITEWFTQWEYILWLISLAMGLNLLVLEVANTKLLHLRFFHMGLGLNELDKLTQTRMFGNVCLEVCWEYHSIIYISIVFFLFRIFHSW